MRILILGGGYAGLRAALDLAALRREGQLPPGVEVDLVERSPCHQVIFWMHQVAAGTLTPEEACIDYGRLPLDGIALHQAEVQGIDPAKGKVHTSAGDLAYDALILALGSVPRMPEIPGLAESAYPLRDRADAERLYSGLETAYARAAMAGDPELHRRLLTTVIAGGGYTGCQLAGELAHRLPDLADRHGIRTRNIRLLLLEGRERLLPEMDACHGRAAREILEAKGVEIRTGTPLERVTEETAVAGGEGIAYGTLGWTGGIRGPALLAESGLPVSPDGRLRVGAFLSCPDHPEVFGGGDCIQRTADDPAPGPPPTATEAMHQGRYLAGRLRDRLLGRSSRPYRPNRLGLLVALGGGDAVGTIGPAPVRGRMAGIVKNGAERSYPDTLRGVRPDAFLSPDFLRPA